MATNWSGNIQLPEAALRVPTATGVLRAVQAHVAAGRRIRAVGGRFSTSRVLSPAVGGTMLELADLRLDKAPGETVAPKLAPFASRGHPKWFRSSTAGLVQISASATVNEVNLYLARQSRAFPMLGSFSGQTFVGAVLTGTHGSGLFGPLADYAVSLDVVTNDAPGQARMLRIERSDGPTNAASFSGATGIAVIQNDEVFNAFVISFGYFGVVTSIVMRTIKQFRLAGVSEIVPWSKVVERLTDADRQGVPHVLRAEYGLGVVMNPYRAVDKTWPTCIWSTSRTTTDASTFLPRPCAALPVFAVAPLVAGLARSEQIPNAVDALVRSMCIPENIGVAHKMLSSPDGFPLRGYGIEFAFRVDAGRSYLTAIRALLDEVAKMENEAPASRIAGFFSLRFVKASSALLAQSYDLEGQPWCTLEVLCAADFGNPDSALPRLIAIALAHRGRAHWGQIFDVDPRVSDFSGPRVQQVFNAHPGYPAWKRQYQHFNSSGVFANDLSDFLP